MIVELSKKVLVTLVVLCVVGFILHSLFTDPVGSAHFIGDVFGKIVDGVQALYTFITSLGD